MRVGGLFSHKQGEEFLNERHAALLDTVFETIDAIDAESCRLKKPLQTEVKRARRIGVEYFYSPSHLNALFEWHFYQRGFDVRPRLVSHNRVGYREMDVVKDRVGIEVQIGKYAFLTYDIVAKMVLFNRFGMIDCGIEICPMASMLPHLSTGIGSFEQVAWDLTYRGNADIDIPVLVIGFEPDSFAQSEHTPRGYVSDLSQASIITERVRVISKKVLDKVRETGLNPDTTSD